MDDLTIDQLRAKRTRERIEEWLLMSARERTESLANPLGRDRYLSLPNDVILSAPGPGADPHPTRHAHKPGCSCGAPDCPQWIADQLGIDISAQNAIPTIPNETLH